MGIARLQVYWIFEIWMGAPQPEIPIASAGKIRISGRPRRYKPALRPNRQLGLAVLDRMDWRTARGAVFGGVLRT